jgi:6-pyruvoyltetrahydropterin/6-carboxytetrahydropterin synthase
VKAYPTRRYRFSASHRLHSDQMSEAQNRATYGKCNNPYGHGHNYALEVTMSGPVEAATGMVCNLADLDVFVTAHVLDRYDHQNLNTLEEFRSRVPTTENLCTAIYRVLERFPEARLEQVRMEETMLNSFCYAGGREPKH